MHSSLAELVTRLEEEYDRRMAAGNEGQIEAKVELPADIERFLKDLESKPQGDEQGPQFGDV